MTRVLLLTLFLLQGTPPRTGVVKGTVRASNGVPAARVRVYAVAYKDAVEAADATPAAFESLTETDASGNYQLDLPPGRYYIASGAVTSPTYYPNTRTTAVAKVITVAANTTVPDIDFESFVSPGPASSGVVNAFISLAPAFSRGTASVSGMIRFPDGTPASGIAVIAVPASMLSANNLVASRTGNAAAYNLVQSLGAVSTTPRTDSSGAYRVGNLGADTYYIIAGFADAPTYYPGTPDVSRAMIVTTTSTSTTGSLDFQIPVIMPGVTVRGTVRTANGDPATNAVARVWPSLLPATTLPPNFSLPLMDGQREVAVGADGTFAFTDVHPGDVVVEAAIPGVMTERTPMMIGSDVPPTVDFVLAFARLSGRVLMEDGRPVPDQRLFGNAIVTTASSPNILASTLMPIGNDGTFSSVLPGELYRFYLRTLPEEYEIRSMKSGAIDLTNETLRLTGKEAINIEVRVAKREAAPSDPSKVRFSGKFVDTTGNVSGGRAVLCCASTGPTERFSSPLRPDGTFEFAAIPPGRYELSLEPGGVAATPTVSTTVNIGPEGLTGATIQKRLR